MQIVPVLNVVVREEDECVRIALGDVEASDGRAEDASEGDSFLEIMDSLDKEVGGESEAFTFADSLQRAD